ncbi:MAG TPA: RNA 2',3'-cyclic phosphodiesterase [Nocardioides sp.]|nr:RNA 2',3'-cyclic phosphodiesterase [Nocardioides sp.]
MPLRLFAAVVPPEDAIEHLDGFLDPRRESAEFRWTTSDQLHVTLAFMAKVDEWRVEEYVDGLAAALEGLPVPVVRIAGPVAFPDAGRARVLATGVVAESEGADDVLVRMAGKARSTAVKQGIEVDGQRFRPHLTLARTGRPTEVSNWVRLLETYVGPEWPIGEVEVISSHLGEGPHRRPRYETLARVPVGR